MHKTEPPPPPPALRETAGRQAACSEFTGVLAADATIPGSLARADHGFPLEQPHDSGLKPVLPGLSFHSAVSPPLRRH